SKVRGDKPRKAAACCVVIKASPFDASSIAGASGAAVAFTARDVKIRPSAHVSEEPKIKPRLPGGDGSASCPWLPLVQRGGSRGADWRGRRPGNGRAVRAPHRQ